MDYGNTTKPELTHRLIAGVAALLKGEGEAMYHLDDI